MVANYECIEFLHWKSLLIIRQPQLALTSTVHKLQNNNCKAFNAVSSNFAFDFSPLNLIELVWFVIIKV